MLAFGAGMLGITLGLNRRAWSQLSTTLPPRTGRKPRTNCGLAVVTGADPGTLARRAVVALGGMDRFVRRGDVVVIKPNIGWDRSPEQAGNTNPEIVAALVTMAKESGARLVKVFDNTCNDARRSYANSGIAAAVKKAGGVTFFVSDWKFYPGRFPAGAAMQDWPLYQDAVECDVFINVPVAKHHGLTGLTLSMKNLMGVCGGNRGRMHWDIDRKLAELTAFIKPDLTVIDAYRILVRNGPTGGNVHDVRLTQTVIAGTDPVLADSYATTLFGRRPEDISYIRAAAGMGLGTMDLKKADIRKIKV